MLPDAALTRSLTEMQRLYVEPAARAIAAKIDMDVMRNYPPAFHPQAFAIIWQPIPIKTPFRYCESELRRKGMFREPWEAPRMDPRFSA
jgi:hypothetical protein